MPYLLIVADWPTQPETPRDAEEDVPAFLSEAAKAYGWHFVAASGTLGRLARCTPMKRYYFDLLDANGLTIDDEGHELPDLAAAQWEAVLTLVDKSRKIGGLSFSLRTDLTIDVRDDAGPVMQVTFRNRPRRAN